MKLAEAREEAVSKVTVTKVTVTNMTYFEKECPKLQLPK